MLSFGLSRMIATCAYQLKSVRQFADIHLINRIYAVIKHLDDQTKTELEAA